MTFLNLAVLLVSTFSYFLQSEQIQSLTYEYYEFQDSCHTKPLEVGLNTSNGVFTDGELPLSLFNEDSRVVAFSKCLKQSYEIRACRMIGIAKNKDSKAFLIRGGNIKREHINEMLELGKSFKIYFENIKVQIPGASCQPGYIESLSLTVK